MTNSINEDGRATDATRIIAPSNALVEAFENDGDMDRIVNRVMLKSMYVRH